MFNPAWEGVEFNLFGTDEFVAFCRAVGCEPLICVNAGDGTPEEAAAWLEYCNGSTQVLGCGYGNEPDSEWNQCLINGAGETLRCVTDHILTGGSVDAATDPVELVHAFMGYPTVLAERYRGLRDRMRAAGIQEPRLAITELQLFAYFQGEEKSDGLLSPATMPRPDTLAEALYLTGIVHTCIRLGDFVELLTHSATVNHGGSLRKERERVYANPVHYAHVLGSRLAGGTPVGIRLSCGTFSTQHSFGPIPPLSDVPVVDAMAVLLTTGDLMLMLSHRSAECGNIALEIALEGAQAQKQADLTTLTGEAWYDRNTLAAPERIVPRHAQVEVSAGNRLALTLAPFSLTQILLKPKER